MRQAAAAAIDKRDELRGLLRAYKAKAARLGAAEDPDLAARHDQAHGLLWTAPCDLAAAEAAVAAYQRAILGGKDGDDRCGMHPAGMRRNDSRRVLRRLRPGALPGARRSRGAAAGWGPAPGAGSIRYAGARPGRRGARRFRAERARAGSGPGRVRPVRVGRGLVNGPGQRRQRQRARHPRLTAGQRPVVAGQARRRARRGAAGPGA